MKRTAVLSAALLLILSLSGCIIHITPPADPAPTGTEAPSPTRTEAAPTQGETAPTRGEKIRPVEVIDAFRKTEEIRDVFDIDTYTCTFAIPALDLTADGAKDLNKRIYDNLYPIYELAHDPEDGMIYNVGYEAHVYRQRVAAILTRTEYMLPYSEYGGCDYEVYYYEGPGDVILDARGYLQALGYDFDRVRAAVEQTGAYKELAASGIWTGDESYPFTDVELTDYIPDNGSVTLLFNCYWAYEADGISYDDLTVRLVTADEQEILALME